MEAPSNAKPHHDVAELFPMMTGLDYATFKEDIKANGLRDPVWTWRGQVIDGRNRERACRELGVECRYREWDGRGSLVAFVVSLNLRRRHLDETQRAVIAAKLKPMLAREAVEGKAEHPEKVSGSPDAIPGANLRPTGRTSHAVAELMNVSPRSVESASKVLRDGTPTLVAAVERGDVSVSAAAAVAELPRREQARAVKAGRAAVLEAAADVHRGKRQAVPKPSRDVDPLVRWVATVRAIRGRLRDALNGGGLLATDDLWSDDAKRRCVDTLRGVVDAVNAAADELASMLAEGGEASPT